MQTNLSNYLSRLLNDLSEFAVILDPCLNNAYFIQRWNRIVLGKLKNYFYVNYYSAKGTAEQVHQEVSKELYTSNHPTTSLFSNVYKKSKINNSNEIDTYIRMSQVSEDTDLLVWWNTRSTSFSSLSQMILDILSIGHLLE